jgi:rRNA biogenesis protein RRP5
MKIESVSYSKLVPGCVVLGQISQISALELALSLPNNITGYVPITNITPLITSQLSAQVEDNSDEEDEDVEMDEENEGKIPELSQLFQVGSWLRAVVVSTETESKKKRVELTIEPSKVNDLLDDEDLGAGMAIQGFVHSIEDHGLIMNIGQDKDVSGFISKKELSHSNIDFEHIRVGAVLLLTILSKSSNGRTLTLTASPLAKKIPVIATISSPENLISGILVEALISEVRSTGLVTKIFGHIDGTVDFIHCGLLDGASLSDKFKPGQKVKARVISTIVSSSEDSIKVALSLLDHVVGFLHHKVPYMGCL